MRSVLLIAYSGMLGIICTMLAKAAHQSSETNIVLHSVTLSVGLSRQHSSALSVSKSLSHKYLLSVRRAHTHTHTHTQTYSHTCMHTHTHTYSLTHIPLVTLVKGPSISISVETNSGPLRKAG